ncbi:MAG: YfhO family protein [Ktedonobacterales bacterium]
MDFTPTNKPVARQLQSLARFLNTPGSVLRWREFCVAMVLFAVLVIAAYPGVIFQNRTLGLASSVAGSMPSGPYGYPVPQFTPQTTDPVGIEVLEALRYLSGHLYVQGQLPLWNPYAGAGTPLAANYVSDGFFLPEIIFNALPYTTWDAYYLLRLLVAGVFAYVFLRGLRLSPLAALLGGSAYMLSGTFTWNMAADWINAFTLLPLYLWVLDHLVAKEPLHMRWMVASTILTALILLSGFPETIVLVLVFSCAYYLFRLSQRLTRANAEGTPKRTVLLSALRRYTIMFLSGVLLASPLLIPFAEYLLNTDSSRLQQVQGLVSPLPHFALRLFVPYFDGNRYAEWNGTTYQGFLGDYINGYSGMVVGCLAVLCCVAAVCARKRLRMAAEALFFAATASVSLILSFNWPLNLSDLVPVVRGISIARYGSGIWMISLAVLAAMASEYLVARDWRVTTLAISLFMLGLGALLVPNVQELQSALAGMNAAQQSSATDVVSTSLLSGALFLLDGVVILLISLRYTQIGRFGLLGIVLVELLAYVPRQLPARYNAYTPPPYLAFVEHDAQPYRVFGLDGVGMPSVSDALGMEDVRLFEAISVSHYAQFIQLAFDPYAFRALGGVWDGEATTSAEPAQLPALEVQAHLRALDLLNVRYILTSTTSLGSSQAVIASNHAPFDLNQGPLLLPGSSLGQPFYCRYDGLSAVLLSFADAPQGAVGVVTLHLRSSRESTTDLRTVTLPLDQVRASGVTRFAFTPIAGSANQNFYVQIDLSESGNSVPLRLWYATGRPNAASGNADVNGRQLPGEGELLAIEEGDAASQPLRLVYNQDVRIYENTDALPRAFVVHDVRTATSDEQAVSLLSNPTFPLLGTLVLASSAPADELAQIGGHPERDGSKVVVTNSTANEVDLQAKMNSSGFVALQDTYYPGWRAYVDGQEVPIYRSDVTFRAVFVPKGSHRISFVYLPPSFVAGAGLALLPPIALVGWLIVNRRRRLPTRDTGG